ncbi:OmpA family protein [Ramlibacter ginsenosidimutans]|uniref:OmpA family protein n=1 Tax=Ramlibacter ginsenosidimutans TaxID=502333 RepID=A0A934TU97_9BURK|nr:OmpA family protein [Ramlibacter ginsenosidimutans]MBK6007498.1 OmpA family protein [Ramlibacter ginsenosidimutans]
MRQIALALAAAALLASCADTGAPMSDTTKSTLIGTGIGALAGAAIGGNAKGAVIGGAVGAAGGYGWSKYMENKKAQMQQATAGSGVNVVQTPDNQLKLEVPSDISFAVGRADINPRLRPILDQFASGLGGQANTEVRIVGHTDNTGGDALNDRLSLERAESVKNYLVDRGVRADSIQVAGRGEREPVADNSTEAGRARNRRVEIFLGERANVSSR